MRKIKWKKSLPFLTIGWSLKREDNLLKTKFDSGNEKSRKKSSLNVYVIEGKLVLSSKDLNIFLNFVEEELEDNSLSFYHTMFLSKDELEMKIDSYSIIQLEDLSYEVSLVLRVFK